MPPPFLPLPHQPVSFFIIKISIRLVSYFLGFILLKEETNYQLCMVIIQIIKTLILAKTFVQEFSGLVLYNFEEVLTCSDELWSPFEFGCNRFLGFLVSFPIKRKS